LREIKFRVWDGTENRFITWTDDLLVSCCGKIFEGDYDYVEEGTQIKCSSSFEIEQFTGLYDKNGKEIYEGDKFCIGGVIMFVSWYEDYACFILTTGCGYDKINCIRLDCDVVYQKEIIGNIHESSEL
jgi:hypothetical protein